MTTKPSDGEQAAALVGQARDQFAEFTALDRMNHLMGQWMGKNADDSISGRFIARLLDVQAAHQHLHDALDAAFNAGATLPPKRR